MEELQQAFFKLADFLGGLKSKVLGEAPGFTGRSTPAGSVSLLDTATQPIIPASLAWAKVNDSQSADEFALWSTVGDIASDDRIQGNQLEGVYQSGAQNKWQNEQNFELPTASQMPLR